MKSCLLIVDVQNGFINDSTKHIPNLVETLQHDYAHVYATRFYNEADSFYRTLIKWNRFDKDSHDFQLAFVPVPHAVIIDKSIYSCVNDSFLQQLREHNIAAVDICGIDTDICVTKCAVDLFEAGIAPKVLGQFCASHAGDASHQFGLGVLQRYIGKAQVVQ